jgi:hypothetical protein
MKTHPLRPSFETYAGTSFEGSLLYLGRKGTAERRGRERALEGRCNADPVEGRDNHGTNP